MGTLQPQAPLVQNGHMNGCEKDSSSPDSAREKLALTPREKKISILEEPPRAQRGITGQSLGIYRPYRLSKEMDMAEGYS